MDNSENQMEMLFDEGGIADDGMSVDPVSGNEIPPGSMASEVRDDIPAQLSEGEYVVPADVLRFYGVKFFEDLRSEAKRGLMDMESNGRIGGEPVGMADPRDAEGSLTPEEMAVLQEMGMAVGGMVPQPTQSTDPYMQQQQMYQQPSPVAVGNTGYNEGGLNTQPSFNADAFAPGFLIDQTRAAASQETTPAVTTVILYSPDGFTAQAFSLPAQQSEYDAKIAEGWSDQQVAVTTETSVGDDDPTITPEPRKTKPYSEMDEAELNKAYADNLKARSILSAMVVINPMFAGLGNAATRLAEKEIKKAMGEKGIEVPEVEEGTGLFASIGNTIKNIFGFGDEEMPVTKATALKPSAEQGGDDSYVPVVADSGTYTTDEDSGITTVVPSQEIQESVNIPEASDELDPFGGAGPDQPSSPPSEDYSSSTYSESSPFNAGGFVAKRSKKKNKKK